MKNHPASEIFPMLTSELIEELAADIKKHGQHQPIVTHEGMILDGRNRFAACMLANVTPQYVPWNNKGGSAVAFVVSVNKHRRHMSPSQAAVAAARAKEAFEKEAEARMKAGKHPIPNSVQGRSVDLAAKSMGVAPSQVQLGDKVIKKAAKKVLDAVDDGDIAVSDAAAVLDLPPRRQEELLEAVRAGTAKTLAKAKISVEKKAQAAELRGKPMPLPAGPFGVIVADPPWQYDLREEDEKHRGKTGYATMPLADIAEMGEQIQAAAAKDCVLWLWCTNAFLVQDDAPIQQVLRAWGFVGKTLITWDKEQLGVGHYLRNSTEHVVLATRGSPMVDGKSTPTLFHAKRREHSRKPDEFFSLIESICPDARRLEVFGRQQRTGWVVWGAEADKFGKDGAA